MRSFYTIPYARHGLYASIALLLTTSSALAAVLPDSARNTIAGQANPGRIQDSLSQGDLNPDLSPKIEVQDLVLQKMPKNAEQIKFHLKALKLEGMGAYKSSDLEPLYADKIGTVVSLADIYAISTALTNKYRNDGYILTQVVVPPQTIEGGDVTLRAVEGYVDRVTVEGEDDSPAMRQIRAYANNVHNQQTALNVRDLEKFLLLINDLPGVDARSILSPSKTQAGASDLRVIVTRDPYDALVGFDNYGSRYLGPLEFSASGGLNSVFGLNERISGQYVIAPDHEAGKELSYLALGYDQPIGIYGTMFKASYNHTNTEPGYTLSEFDVLGRSDFIGLTLEHPFIRTRAENLYMHTTLDWRDVVSKNNLEPTRHDTISALRVGGRYEFLDSLFSAGINSVSVEASHGLDVLAATKETDTNKSRDNGDPTFSKINFEAQRLQRIVPKLNLLVAGRGQYASGALLSSEEFGVGGIGIGRGYDSSEIVGDHGIAGKLELQWNKPYTVSYLEDYQLFGFYDVGKVWNDEATSRAEVADSLASTGFGVRADFLHDIKGGLAVAFPLTRDVETQHEKKTRFYVNLNKSF
jgi:hemolysin activation/secretion protein